MLICPKCHKEQEDGAKFCDACGAQIFETVFCPNCGEKTSTEFAFCEQCGASIQEDVTVKTVSEEHVSKKKIIGEVGKLPKKLLVGVGIAVVVVLAAVFIRKLFTGESSRNYCLYLKDGAIVYDDFSENGAFELTSLGIDNVSNSEFESDDGTWISSDVKFSENGKYVFYPDRVNRPDDEVDGFTIYCRNINKPNKEPVKIDSEVIYYEINNDGTQVIYLKEDGGLYSHDLENKEKIASEVEVKSFHVANDCKKIGFLKSNGGYYVYSEGKEIEKIASDIEEIIYVSEDLSVIYYRKEGGLYRRAEGEKDVTKISSDVAYVKKIYDSGEIYYTKEKTAEVKLTDYVVDDMADADAAMTEPESPDYPSGWDYDTEEAYNAAVEQYETAYNAYETAYGAYTAKMERDVLRETLQESTFEKSVYTLYYYDGKESVVITDALTDDDRFPCAQDSPAIIYQEYNQAEVTKVKLSEISSGDEVEELVRAALYASAATYLAVGEQTSVLEQTDVQEVIFSADEKSLYFLDDVSDDDHGDLYKAAITDKAVQKPELVDNGVYCDRYGWGLNNVENTLVYFKNYDSEKNRGDLWIDGKEIDYDVSLYSRAIIKDGSVYYRSDWNNEKYCGTLKMYVNEKTIKVADDVYNWRFNEGDILYLYDYSQNSQSGMLYLYKNGESEKIADDVTSIIYY